MKTTIHCKITYSKADNCWYVEAPGFYDGIMTDGATLEIAKKMLGRNRPLAEIIEDTGLTREEVEGLRQ